MKRRANGMGNGPKIARDRKVIALFPSIPSISLIFFSFFPTSFWIFRKKIIAKYRENTRKKEREKLVETSSP